MPHVSRVQDFWGFESHRDQCHVWAEMFVDSLYCFSSGFSYFVLSTKINLYIPTELHAVKEELLSYSTVNSYLTESPFLIFRRVWGMYQRAHGWRNGQSLQQSKWSHSWFLPVKHLAYGQRKKKKIKCMSLAFSFAFQFNPALQPRTIVVLGCISKEADDTMVQRILHVLIVVSRDNLYLYLYLCLALPITVSTTTTTAAPAPIPTMFSLFAGSK